MATANPGVISKKKINFDEEEERILLQIVEKFKSTIECKKTGSFTWTEKKNAWSRIENEFNTQSGRSVRRSADQLKEKYNNLKKKSKRKFAENEINVMKTGGGSYNPVEITDVDRAMYDIIGPQVSGIISTYDDDYNEVNMETESNKIDNEIEIELLEPDVESIGEENMQPKSPNSSLEDKTWGTYTHKSLKRPISNKLKVKRRMSKKVVTQTPKQQKKYISISYEVMEAKKEFIHEQKCKFRDEHNIKMKIYRRKLAIANEKCKVLGITVED